MTVLFYRRDGGAPFAAAALPAPYVLRIWSPGDDGPPPRGSRRLDNWIWWTFERLGLFSRRGFRELTIWSEGRLAHRLIVTPRWFRFPFMRAGDLQVGDLLTAPQMRGRGLARMALTAVQMATDPGERLWYVTDARNLASIALAESAGYRLVGKGRRTRPLGVALFGRFVSGPSGG